MSRVIADHPRHAARSRIGQVLMAGRCFGVLERQLPTDFLSDRLFAFGCQRRGTDVLGLEPGSLRFISRLESLSE